jgi:hypothetical protein
MRRVLVGVGAEVAALGRTPGADEAALAARADLSERARVAAGAAVGRIVLVVDALVAALRGATGAGDEPAA